MKILSKTLLGMTVFLSLSLVGCTAKAPIEDEPQSETSPEQSELKATGTSYAQVLAKEAYNLGKNRSSSGRCYEFVWKALENAQRKKYGNSIHDSRAPSTSAYQFGDYARRSGTNNDLNNNLGLKLASYKDISRAPIGSVVVWKRSGCGFSARHGHIEVKTSMNPADKNYLCSDFCRSDYSCSANDVSAILEPIN